MHSNAHTLSAVLPRGGNLRRNPPVTIEDWASDEEDASDEGSAIYDTDHSSVNSKDQDPVFLEREEPLGLHPDDEPEFDEEDLWNMLQQQLGDLADDEWIDLCKYSYHFLF